MLATDGTEDIETDPLAVDIPVLAQLSAAAVRGRSAFGDRASTPVLRVAMRPMPHGCGRSTPATRTLNASTSMPIAMSAPMTASGSKDSADTFCVPRSRKSDCHASPTAGLSAPPGIRGTTAPAT